MIDVDTLKQYLYPLSLLVISVAVALAERIAPWRPEQKVFRKALWSDALHLVFNSHFLGVILFGVATYQILPIFDQQLTNLGIKETLYMGAAKNWPIWLQIIVALVVTDFLQWCVHNVLHRVPFLWNFHKLHHSIVDGEMDWIVSFRFQWTEVIVYRSVLYLPLAFFAFGYEAVMFHAIFGTLIGHLNHANLNISWGPLRYIFNSPRMHIWHHDYEGGKDSTVNFGIIFSTWDWIFGTASMPDEPPARLGFHGVSEYPTTFFSQLAWPLSLTAPVLVRSAFGIFLIAFGLYISQPKAASSATPMLGEVAASSQPASRTDFDYPQSQNAANENVQNFGMAFSQTKYAHPEAMVSVDSLAAALGAQNLRLIDVRPRDRFASGHIPSAIQVDRPDYSAVKPIHGLSFDRAKLIALLSKHGIQPSDEIVLYGDGGPEPYRLWWTLRHVLGLQTRVLDGGLIEWKANGHGVAQGDPIQRASILSTSWPRAFLPQDLLWKSIEEFARKATLVDARTVDEFSGDETRANASKPGRIPGAIRFEWTRVFRTAQHPTLKSVDALMQEFARAGIPKHGNILTMCQSGTRSAAVFYAFYQAGKKDEELKNYDGSWAEYSQLNLPTQTGATGIQTDSQ